MPRTDSRTLLDVALDALPACVPDLPPPLRALLAERALADLAEAPPSDCVSDAVRAAWFARLALSRRLRRPCDAGLALLCSGGAA